MSWPPRCLLGVAVKWLPSAPDRFFRFFFQLVTERVTGSAKNDLRGRESGFHRLTRPCCESFTPGAKSDDSDAAVRLPDDRRRPRGDSRERYAGGAWDEASADGFAVHWVALERLTLKRHATERFTAVARSTARGTASDRRLGPAGVGPLRAAPPSPRRPPPPILRRGMNPWGRFSTGFQPARPLNPAQKSTLQAKNLPPAG